MPLLVYFQLMVSMSDNCYRYLNGLRNLFSFEVSTTLLLSRFSTLLRFYVNLSMLFLPLVILFLPTSHCYLILSKMSP